MSQAELFDKFLHGSTLEECYFRKLLPLQGTPFSECAIPVAIFETDAGNLLFFGFFNSQIITNLFFHILNRCVCLMYAEV